MNLFREMASAWRFVPIRLPVLALYARTIQAAEQLIIINDNRLLKFSALFFSYLLYITIDTLFLNVSRELLLSLPNCLNWSLFSTLHQT